MQCSALAAVGGGGSGGRVDYSHLRSSSPSFSQPASLTHCLPSNALLQLRQDEDAVPAPALGRRVAPVQGVGHPPPGEEEELFKALSMDRNFDAFRHCDAL